MNKQTVPENLTNKSETNSSPLTLKAKNFRKDLQPTNPNLSAILDAIAENWGYTGDQFFRNKNNDNSKKER